MGAKEDKQEQDEKKQSVLSWLKEQSQSIVNKDRKTKANSVSTVAARDHLFLEQLTTSLETVFSKKLPTPTYNSSKKSKTKIQRILNLILSDLHYGSRFDTQETNSAYGPIEEARRTAAIVKQVVDYKPQYRDETELYVHLLGDIIQNSLHDPRDGAPLAEQAATAIRILIQALSFLALNFPKVTIFCTTGNHGRNKARHKDRAVNQRWDSIETIIYVAVKEALAIYPNVKVNIPLTPFYTFSAFDQRGFMTHGDAVIRGGFPSKAIDVSSVTKQINTINTAFLAKKEQPCSLFAIGHVHTGSLTHLPGAKFMSNGCLLPPDAYALSIGIFETACGQQMWESVPGHIVGDSRFVQVNEETDRDASLDKIIQPYNGF